MYLTFLSVIYAALFWESCSAASPAPPGVRVFAISFPDLALELTDKKYDSHVTVTSYSSANARISLTFADNRTVYNLLRASNSYTAEFLTDALNFVAPGLSNKGVIVVTKDTAGVEGHNALEASGDSFLALPLTVNNKNYYVASYPAQPSSSNPNDYIGTSILALTAASTACLEISRVVNGQFEIQDSFQMEYGQSYQMYSTGDLTGLYISSSTPISVIAGHECAAIPEGTEYCDHMLEMIPSINQWGTTSVVPPIIGRLSSGQYTLRILAQEVSTATTITFPYNSDLVELDSTHGCGCEGLTFDNCVTGSCQLTFGQFMEVKVTDLSVPVTVVCTSPCLVTQYAHSLRASGATEPRDPDGFMMITTPVDHYVNQMSYHTPKFVTATGALASYDNFLSIVVKTADRSGVLLDDAEVTDAGIVQGDYTIISLSMTDDYHRLSHTDSTKTLVGFAYGHSRHSHASGTSTSYGFPIAYEIDDITIPGDWEAEIAVPPGTVDEDLVTPAPRVCSRFIISDLTEEFTVRGIDSIDFAVCNSVITAVTLVQMRDLINDAICQQQICFGVPEDVFVVSLAKSVNQSINALDINVQLTVTKDTVIRDLIGCRVHIINYLERVEHWVPLLTSSGLNSCETVIETFSRTASELSCPID